MLRVFLARFGAGSSDGGFCSIRLGEPIGSGAGEFDELRVRFLEPLPLETSSEDD